MEQIGAGQEHLNAMKVCGAQEPEEMLGVPEAFRGKRILVVEDECLLADELKRQLAGRGAIVIGPVASSNEALALVDDRAIDAAILDIELHEEISFPVADTLDMRGVPYIFVSMKTRHNDPELYPGFLVDNPSSLDAMAEALFPRTRH